jgi:tellurite resistance protein TerC
VTIAEPVLYAIFAAVVVALLAIDLLVAHRETHAVTLREAAIWSAIWIGVSVLFGIFVPQFHQSAEGSSSLLYFTGYLIEKSLSVDNVFLFVVIFGTLSVPKELQHRVLFYGVVGAIVMRTVLIFTGAALIERFEWILYVFGAFLLYAAWRTYADRHGHPDVTDSKLIARVRRIIPTTDRYEGEKFFVKRDGKRYATPLFIVLILVEFTDLVFAMDSIPAIFAITRDPFIVLTSNIFAILGLRALYFLLAGVADKLRYLKVGLAVILAYVGVKLLTAHVEGIWHPSPLQSLAIIGTILGVVVVASLVNPPESEEIVKPDAGPWGSEDEQDAAR